MFHVDVEGKCGWIIGGGGAKDMLAPHQKLLGGTSLPTPMDLCFNVLPLIGLRRL